VSECYLEILFRYLSDPEASDEAVLFELDLHRIGAPKACALAGWRMTSTQVEQLHHLRDRGDAYAAALVDTPQGLQARWSWVLEMGRGVGQSRVGGLLRVRR